MNWPSSAATSPGRFGSRRLMARVRKTEGTDFSGKPYLFTEIEIGRKGVALRYSLPPGHSRQARHLHSCLLLLRVLSLVPGLELGAAGACNLLLPALEFSSFASGADYSLLHSKFDSLLHEAEELRHRNRELQHSSEEEAAISVERERRISALSGRVARLESLSDAALSELILDWISSHHGSFSLIHFSQQNRVPPSRAEEGLESILKSGIIRMVGGRLHVQRQEDGHLFEIALNGLQGRLNRAISGLRGRAPPKK